MADRPDSLQGRVAVVTGASRGIGAATARALAGEGARVVLAARRSEALEHLGQEIGGLVVPTDVRDPEQVQSLADAAGRELGGIDLLVAAAGLGRFATVADQPLADWDDTFAVNLRGTFLTCQAALPYLLRSTRGGHIFTLVSIAATRTFPGSAAYCASKAGLLAFTRVLAEEVRRQGVRVTAVLPGSVDSPFWDSAGGTELPREAMLRPDDIAGTIVGIAKQPSRVYTDEITIMPPAGVL